MRLKNLLFMVIAVLAAFMLVTTVLHFNSIVRASSRGMGGSRGGGMSTYQFGSGYNMGYNYSYNPSTYYMSGMGTGGMGMSGMGMNWGGMDGGGHDNYSLYNYPVNSASALFSPTLSPYYSSAGLPNIIGASAGLTPFGIGSSALPYSFGAGAGLYTPYSSIGGTGLFSPYSLGTSTGWPLYY